MSEKKPNNSEKIASIPKRLTDQEILIIVTQVGDDRLQINEDGEHFTIHLDEKVVYIPKREKIYIQNDSGNINSIKTEKYIKQILKEHDEKKHEIS